MAKTAIGTGVILIVVGLVAYFATATGSFTALIPAFLGLIIAALGFVGLRDNLRKHAMHAAAAVALLGILGSLPRAVPGWGALLTGGNVELPVALFAQTATIIVCAVFVALAVRSFIEARRQRQSAA